MTAPPIRCAWAEKSDAERAYHDAEWGLPLHGDAALFELLTLEGAQAGLSWRTVLVRRDGYRRAFHGFDIARVAAMTDEELEGRMADPGLIRHRRKIASVRTNAQAARTIQQESGSLDAFLWGFVEGTPQVNHWESPADVPARTPLSDRLSLALRQRGFTFVGPMICYAFLQASGMVCDHLTYCFRHPDAEKII